MTTESAADDEAVCMTRETTETVRKLLADREGYVLGAVVQAGIWDEQMSDGGTDSLYAESARALRRVEHDIRDGDVDEADYPLLVESILRWELAEAEEPAEERPDEGVTPR